MMRSDRHREWRIKSIERLMLPPMVLSQYKMFWGADGIPVGLATWAFLTPEAADGYVNRTRQLQPEDWNAGDQLWFIDFIADGIPVVTMVRDLYKMFPDHKRAYTYRVKRKKVGWYDR
jgi:cytolysin-activating lysine-acyltransferase